MNSTVLVFALLIGAFVIGTMAWHFSRANSLLEQWAQENGFTVVESRRRTFFRGPFFWNTAKSQEVYQVRVRDLAGNERTGYVRCGGFFLGMLSDNTEVRWDDE